MLIVLGVAKPAEFGKRFMVFGTVRPFLGSDHVVEARDDDRVPAERESRGPLSQRPVAKAVPVAIRDLGENVEVARVGTPRGDFHGTEHLGVDLGWQRFGVFVAESFSANACVQFAHGFCEPGQVLLASFNNTVEIVGRAGRSVGDGGHPSDEQVSHVVSVEHLDEPVDV